MKPKQSSNRSVNISGNTTGTVIQTGDRNVGTVNYQQVTLPLAEKVDIQAELKALHEILAKINAVDNRKIDNAFSDIEDELTKSQPDKDEIGKALERALKYAEKADNFASSIEKFAPKIMKIANWLGESWHKILEVVSLQT